MINIIDCMYIKSLLNRQIFHLIESLIFMRCYVFRGERSESLITRQREIAELSNPRIEIIVLDELIFWNIQ